MHQIFYSIDAFDAHLNPWMAGWNQVANRNTTDQEVNILLFYKASLFHSFGGEGVMHALQNMEENP